MALMDVSTATGAPTYCGATVGKTAWFEVTPAVSGPMVFSTCHPSTTYDTVIQAFSGGNSECQAMASEGCNDDASGAFCDNGCSYSASAMSISATAGVRYRFEVGAFGDNSADCTLCLGVVLTIGTPCGDVPTNLACATAEVLPGTPGVHEAQVDVEGAIVPASEPQPSCTSTPIGHSVWFSVTPEVSGTLKFTTCTPQTTYDTVLAAYTFADGCATSSMAQGCSDDDASSGACDTGCPPGLFRGSTVSLACQAGQAYLFQVGSYGKNSAGCDLCLGVRAAVMECAADGDCDDGDPCTANTCQTGVCVTENSADGTPCGNPASSACDDSDSCQAGVCQSNFWPAGTVCTDDGDDCTDDVCSLDGVCVHPTALDGAPCGNDVHTDCDDADSCRSGVCEPNYRPAGTSCADDMFCNGDEACDGSGGCLASQVPACSNGTVCNEAASKCDSDCNLSGQADSLDIANGQSMDSNANGVPDECENLRVDTMAGVTLLTADSLIPPRISFVDGLPRAVEAKVAFSGSVANDALFQSLAFLDRYRDLYGVTAPSTTFFLKRIIDYGHRDLFFGQQRNGIPVHAASLAVHLDGDFIIATNGLYLRNVPVLAPEIVSASAAETIARGALAAPAIPLGASSKLMYYNPVLVGDSPDETHLVWRVILRGELMDGASGKWTIFVDAHDGQLLSTVSEEHTGMDLDISTANGDTSSTCWSWPHSDPTTQWFTEGGPTGSYPGGASNYPGGDEDGDASYLFSIQVYDWFKNNFGRRSYDDDDEQIEVYMHVGGACPNAWANTTCLKFCNGTVVLDIFAHEFTHSMGDETGDLDYVNQSGALDESYADVFGSIMDWNWIIGEGSSYATGCSGAPPGTIRNLADPTQCGDPDHMSNLCTSTNNFCNYHADGGGVHTNSSIPNKVAYLIAMGGTHNGLTMSGMGTTKLRQLYYQVYTREIGGNAAFMDARNATVRVAQQWQGIKHGITSQNVCDVVNAYASVGLGGSDLDCDGIPDTTDTDDDGDHIPDSNDNCPLIGNPNQKNTDGDGDGGDACDPDNDNDGVPDDGNGSGEGDNPCTSGIITPDCDDNCPTTFNENQADDDGDGIGDHCDDDDYDWILNSVDNCRHKWNRDQADHDGDHLGDVCDPDDDNDSIPDVTDSCPFDANVGQDPDEDGVDNACDNCPTTDNPGQSDNDADGDGDACDLDDDNDGVPDTNDICPRRYDPDQTGLACNDNILAILAGFEKVVPVDFVIPFPFPGLISHVTLPLTVIGDVVGPAYLSAGYRMTVDVSMPINLPMMIVDDRGRAVARASEGLDKRLSFRPSPASHYAPLNAGGMSAGLGGRGSSASVFAAERYSLIIYTTPEVVPNQPYPISMTLHSHLPAAFDLNHDGAVDLLDYRVFHEAAGGPGQQTLDTRADFDGDSDTDLLDFAAFQQGFADP